MPWFQETTEVAAVSIMVALLLWIKVSMCSTVSCDRYLHWKGIKNAQLLQIKNPKSTCTHKIVLTLHLSFQLRWAKKWTMQYILFWQFLDCRLMNKTYRYKMKFDYVLLMHCGYITLQECMQVQSISVQYIKKGFNPLSK